MIWAVNHRLLASNGAIRGGTATFDGQDLLALNDRQILSVPEADLDGVSGSDDVTDPSSDL